jgi:1,4-dihydroxy-2-naphthoate octaprenyltransferase
MPFWVHFAGSCNGRYWYILLPFGMYIFQVISYFCVFFVAIWYIFPVWVFCIKKNLATLASTHATQELHWLNPVTLSP